MLMMLVLAAVLRIRVLSIIVFNMAILKTYVP